MYSGKSIYIRRHMAIDFIQTCFAIDSYGKSAVTGLNWMVTVCCKIIISF